MTGCCNIASGIPPANGGYNFSYREIYFNTVIKEHQQMIVKDGIYIFTGYTLYIQGELSLI